MRRNGFLARRPWILAVLLAAAVSLWMLSGQLRDRPEPAQPAAAAAAGQETDSGLPRVRTRTQQAEEVTRWLTINGRTEPSRIVELDAETLGRVTAIITPEGRRTTGGEPILRLDARDRQVRLEQARATLKQRELEYAARQELQREGYVSETQLAEGMALLEAARAELKRAELDLDYMTLRAPFDGSVQELYVEVGDYVQVGDPLARFVDNETLLVAGYVSEMERNYLGGEEYGEAQLITGAVAEGRIRYIAPVADSSTRTFRVEMEIDNREARLPSGVTAELRIPAGTVYAQRVSPALLTLDDEGNMGVKILDPAGRVEFREADIAASTPSGVWLAGLPEVTTFITVGQGFVRAGERVTAVPEDPDDTALAAEGQP